MRRPAVPILAAVAAVAVVVVVVDVILRPRTGPLALAAVLEGHLLAVGVCAGGVASISSWRMGRTGAWARLVTALVLVVAIVRLGGEWWSPAPEPVPNGATELRVLSWNLELGSKAAGDTVAGIAERDVDLVALQELTPDVAAAIEADETLVARFPYRILESRDGVAGVGLMSRLPLVVGSYAMAPVVLRAGLLLPDGQRIEVFDVHPYPATMTRWAGLPVGLDTRRRDEDLARIRAVVDALPDPSRAMVIGDLNASPFEPGFGTLADGLHDAHAEAATGPGFTWRPSSLEVLGLGLLRIDVVLAGDRLRPVAAGEACSLPGDHCRLYATFAVERKAP